MHIKYLRKNIRVLNVISEIFGIEFAFAKHVFIFLISHNVEKSLSCLMNKLICEFKAEYVFKYNYLNYSKVMHHLLT